jgi:dCTP deaminase
MMAHNLEMIVPFEESLKREGVISYGLSSYGYDIRIAGEFKVFVPTPYNAVVDPKAMDKGSMYDYQGDRCVIPPNSFVLGRSVERIRMPENVLGIVVGKSTYARCGLVLNTTPLEPGWCGHITLEISNTTPLPAVVYANEGIGQILFLEGDERCEVTYASRNGKYQNQTGVTLPRIET